MSRHACTPRSACLGIALTISIGLANTSPSTAQDEKRYDTGASDTTIKIGNTAPYSGPLSSNGIIAKTEGAYFRMINDQGGVNGRKIEFISYDDAYSPPKTVEQTRKLIESDEVLFSSINSARRPRCRSSNMSTPRGVLPSPCLAQRGRGAGILLPAVDFCRPCGESLSRTLGVSEHGCNETRALRLMPAVRIKSRTVDQRNRARTGRADAPRMGIWTVW
jgi:hypothetical protein